jgi:hypothetical protein
MKGTLIFRTPLTNGLFWGLAGGMVLFLIRFLPLYVPVAEIIMLLSFILFLFPPLLTFNPRSADMMFLQIFFSSLITFMSMFIVVHAGLFMVFQDTGILPKLILPFFIMLGAGTLFSLGLAALAVRKLKVGR